MALRTGLAVTVAGVAGSLADSVLGERLQERRYCPACESYTESRLHHCGTESRHVSGIEGFDNDLVNLVCTAVGCIVTLPFVCATIDTSLS
jgi:uncharacterized membrane protein